jgi:hypothetical protein
MGDLRPGQVFQVNRLRFGKVLHQVIGISGANRGPHVGQLGDFPGGGNNQPVHGGLAPFPVPVKCQFEAFGAVSDIDQAAGNQNRAWRNLDQVQAVRVFNKFADPLSR